MQKRILPFLSILFLLFCFSGKTRPTSESIDFIKPPGVPWIQNVGQFPNDEAFRMNGFAGPVVIDQSNSIKYLLLSETGTKLFFSEQFKTKVDNKAEGIEKSPTQVNYFKGKQVFQDIPTYNALKISDLWNGIDVELHGMNENVEKIFKVEAGADPGHIRIQVDGITDICISGNGELQLDIGVESMTFSKPKAYQIVQNMKMEIAVNYCIDLDDQVAQYGFKLGNYDRSCELIIDPIIASTFLGSTDNDNAHKIALGNNGKVYVCGTTESIDFPTTPGVYDDSFNDTNEEYDIFVSRFSADLSVLEASTFIGGNDEDDVHDLIIDMDGHVFICGEAVSRDYPTTAGAYDRTHDGNAGYAANIFISKFNADLNQLIASTFVGTEWNSNAYAMTLINQDNLLIGGYSGGELPEVGPQFQSPCEGIYFLKINNELNTVLATNSIDEGSNEGIRDIEIGPSGNVYATGYTDNLHGGFPTTNGAYDETHNGAYDLFIIKLDQSLSNNLACTFLGGYHDDVGSVLTFDQLGNVCVGGNSKSSDFPTSPGAYDETWDNTKFRNDGVFAKFDPSLSTLIYSTYFGAVDQNDEIVDILFDENNSFFVLSDASYDMPVFCNSVSNSGFGTHIAHFNPALNQLEHATYLNGWRGSNPGNFLQNPEGNLYICGGTASDDFPTLNGYDNTFNYEELSWNDAFVSLLTPDLTHGLPCCASIIYPIQGATEIQPDVIVEWNAAPYADGYYLSAGTTEDPYSLISQMDVGNVLSYEVNDLPCGELVSVSIDAYNENGTAVGAECGPVTFYTKNPDFAEYYDTICQGEIFYWEGFPLYYEGRFRVIYENQYGCDSTLQMNLSVWPTFSQSEEMTICEGETVDWLGQNYEAPGDYYRVFMDVNGCDSIYHLSLSVYPSDTLKTEMAICDGDSYVWENQELTEAGEYLASYQNEFGCDSILELQLSVHPTYAFYEETSICRGDTLEWQGQTLTEEGYFEAIYTTSEGCDSIFNLELTLLQEYEFHEEQTICEGDSYDWQGGNYTVPGSYSVHYHTMDACDSSYYLTLTLAPVYHFEEELNLCPEEQLQWQGMLLESGGEYEASYQSEWGCDSTYFLTLTPISIDTSVTIDGDRFSAVPDDQATYQWMDCLDYHLIEGATQSTYEAVASGVYAVIIEKENCRDTSLCHALIHSGYENVKGHSIMIYPNPVFQDDLHIQITSSSTSFSYKLIDTRGHTLKQATVMDKESKISTADLVPGLYFLQCQLNGSSEIKRIIIL
jgi:hypothetical protein